MAKRWRFIVQRGRSAQFSLRGSQHNRLRARTFSIPNEPLYPTGTYHWKSYSAHLLYSPAPLFPRSLVWSELSEGDLTALSPRVFEWSSEQRGDLYSQKSGLKQRWPRAPEFTAYTGSMLRDAFAEGPLSFSLSLALCFSLDYTVFAIDLNNNWWERSIRQRAGKPKRLPSQLLYSEWNNKCTPHNLYH